MKLKIITFKKSKMITLYEGIYKKEEIEFFSDHIKKICLLFTGDKALNSTYKKSKEYTEIRNNNIYYVIELKLKKPPKNFFYNLNN